MNCDKTQQCMLYLWGEMTPGESQAFAEHLRQCSVCKAQVEQLAPLVRSMQAIEPEQLPDGLAERVRIRLSRSQEHPRRLWITPRRAVAVAASILLILGLSVMWQLMFNGTQQSISPVAQTLTEDDYVEALALVWISESELPVGSSSDSADSLAAEIEDVAADIEYLLQQVDDTLAPTDSDGQPNGVRDLPRLDAIRTVAT